MRIFSLEVTLMSLLIITIAPNSKADPAEILFEDNFEGGIPGWTTVQPPGAYNTSGLMIWSYDPAQNAFFEGTDMFTDLAASSTSRIAGMFINDTVAPADFVYSARLTAGDDDGFGLIWGYENETTFYRIEFARQNRAGWPFTGWHVDRMSNNVITELFGANTAHYAVGYTNVAGRPFDVTIAVAGGIVNITLVDDPLGTPVTNNLVVDQPLPSSPSGKVGMFSWGMFSQGGGVHSFRVQNPELSPTPLTGVDLSTLVLTNWSFVVTPRTDGAVLIDVDGPPVWSYGVDKNGFRGAMMENSGSYRNSDNNASGTTHFTAPSAVAGDEAWTNYVYSARIYTADDDGFGLLLRYQNPTNFYRIGFRGQASSSGVKRGISVQKNIDRTFSELFYDAAHPVPFGNAHTPIDVHASIRNDRLQIIVVNDADSASAQTFSYGPIDITDTTLANGMIGIFSWAQQVGPSQTTASGTEVDSVQVRNIGDEESLVIYSPQGTASALEVTNSPLGSSITVSAAPIDVSPGVRQIPVGWTGGTGSVPATGDTSSVTFTLDAFSTIRWLWVTQYFEISNISISGGNVVLDISNPGGGNYHVLRASNVLGPYTTNAANQSASQYSEPISAEASYFYKLQLLP